MVTEAEKKLIEKLTREEPSRVKAEAKQKANEWLNENIVEVVKVLKTQVKKAVKS